MIETRAMNLADVKREITELSKIPASEKMYPITSDWVPLPDVLAIISRYEKSSADQTKKSE